MSINKVILLGNVGKQPEIKTFENGNRVARFTLATSERYKDRNGEQMETTEWHNITVLGNTVGIVEKYVTKGRQVFVEGKIRTRSWETQSGEKRYSTEIVCQSLQLVGKAPSDSDNNNYDHPEEGDGDLPF